MKRIMLLAILVLMLVPIITKAHSYYATENRVHWSPQVFGLISGGLHYNPWAFKYGHSGLVSDDLYYSPYAFKYGRSGLVHDSWHSYTSRSVRVSSCQPQNSFRIRRHYKKRGKAKVNNGRQVISDYLTTKGIKFRVVDGCSVSNVDFLLTNMNIILRYQDPTEAQRFEDLPEDNYKRILYERYRQRSAERFKGFPAYMIKATDEKRILTGLMLCPDLN